MKSHLILMTPLYNGQRFVAIMNLRMRAFRYAMDRHDSSVMTVIAHHKTFRQGAAT